MKKYSEKFLEDYSILQKAVIGFEFEFYMKDLSFYKTLEMLNKELEPVKVHGFRQYHSGYKPDRKNFKIEPDLSGGTNMVELVTGPLEYGEAKFYLIKILNFIQKYGYTNDKSSIHFNLSFNDNDKNLNDLNILKLILRTDEEEIYRFFPSRKGNIYAKTIKQIIPYKQYDFFNIGIDSVKNALKLPGDKYFGINFLHINDESKSQRLEYRYIGGKDYEKNVGNILFFLNRFILDTYNSIDTGFNDQDMNDLEEYLETNIKKYQSFSKYDNFLVEYPKIQLQIDQNGSYSLVSSYFSRVYEKLFDLTESIENLTDCIINYVTTTQTLEVIDAKIKAKLCVKNIEFITCQVEEGIFEDCLFYGSSISNSQISKSKIENSDVQNSKVLSCRVEGSSLKNCYFMNGYLNGDMEGGVLRSGEMGPFATVSPETKIVDDLGGGFFHTKYDSMDKADYSKSTIKSFKK
jgi:hypothetical protein